MFLSWLKGVGDLSFFLFKGFTFGDKLITYRCFCSGELFSAIFTGNSTASNFWGNQCNVRTNGVLPWKPRIFRSQLPFFCRCCVGISYCNLALLCYRILSLQNIICNNFVSNVVCSSSTGSQAYQRESNIGQDLVGVGIGGVWNGHFPESENIFQRPIFLGKSLKFCRKSDFRQISGSEI